MIIMIMMMMMMLLLLVDIFHITLLDNILHTITITIIIIYILHGNYNKYKRPIVKNLSNIITITITIIIIIVALNSWISMNIW